MMNPICDKFTAHIPLRSLLIAVILAIAGTYANAQEHALSPEQKGLIHSELSRYNAAFLRNTSGVTAEDRIDVSYYLLDLKITASPQYLRGRVVLKALSRQNNLTGITLDLMNALTIDSVKTGGVAVPFVQHSSSFDLTLDHAYNSGELIVVEIYYQGVPGSSGFGSFEFSAHSSTPWIWSLSEPYGAKDWWPCKDHPTDKADSSDMYVTCDSSFKVGSNGKLMSITNNGDGTSTTHWQERHPISTYLISVAITNYSQFVNYFHSTPADSMPVLNYVLPEDLSTATTMLPRVLDGLQIYSRLFGLYPFYDEKYGHSEFGWGGGMEHQTMTSICCFDESIAMHELAHQWFGDMITCRTWPDVWLNEGFATYCEIVYEEQKYGEGNYSSLVQSDMVSAKAASGSVAVPDSDNVGSLFDWNRVYAKGAIVLHMLRHVLGDSVFFHAMYNYAQNPALRFNTASTSDFESVCESTSGKNLSYFFNEWIYGMNYPHYAYSWSSRPDSGGYKVTIVLSQSTGTSNPSYFTMPIDFKILGADGDTTITFFNDSSNQTFTCHVPQLPNTVQLDPAGWILKDFSGAVFNPSTSVLNFGPVVTGLSHTVTLLITNTGTSVLGITSATSTNPEFSVSPATAVIQQNGGAGIFFIAFHPTSPGPKSGHIVFTHNGLTSPDSIDISGTGADSILLNFSGPRWNMVSAAFSLPDMRVGSIFPTTASRAFSYSPGSNYVLNDTMKIGAGYWIRLRDNSPVVQGGEIVEADTLPVATGWNLIGSISSPVPAPSIVSIPDGLVTSNFFGYDGTYNVTDTLFPGRGYWVKSTGDGALILARDTSVHAIATRAIRIVPISELPPAPPSGDNNSAGDIPTSYLLQAAYPNPFNPTTTLRYDLPSRSQVRLVVFDLLGMTVATVTDGIQEAGRYEYVWNAARVASGVYFCRLEAYDLDHPAEMYVQTGKLLLMK